MATTTPPRVEVDLNRPGLLEELGQTIVKGTLKTLSLKETLRFLNSTRRIETVSNLLLLNGFIFGGSLGLWEWAVLPSLDRLGTWLLADEDGVAGMHSSEAAESAKNTAKQFVTLFWLIPLLLLSVLLNMVWYSEIAEDAFKKRKLKIKPGSSNSIRDQIYRLILLLVLTIQSLVTLNLLPKYIGYPIEFIQSSWTIAFYCYDYRWSFAGLSLEERINLFEIHWPFMLGFGAPLSALALWLPLYWGYVAYGLFFPICVILAIETDPVLHRRGWQRVRTFRLSQYLTLWLIRLIGKAT